MFSKKIDNDPLLYIRAEFEFGPIELDKLFVMIADVEHRAEWDGHIKKLEIVKEFAPHLLISYNVMSMPFPFVDREGIHIVLRICNKKNPELVEKFNLPQKEEKYYLVFNMPIKIEEYPESEDLVRYGVFSITIFEEILDKPGFIRGKALVHMDMGGNFPNFLVNILAAKSTPKSVDSAYKRYLDLDQKGLLNPK